MGIFYLDARMVSKAKQSAVAKAAYVSNEKLYSERDEEMKQYRTRTEKPESFILAPEHAPEWVKDREKLWNEVEKVEKNYNSQLLREIVVALPIELSPDQQNSLVKEYVQENFVADGMVADVNIHRDQEQNPHAHILLTVRPFNQDGTWWNSKSKKEYILDENGEVSLNAEGKKRSRKIDLTGWNDKSKLLQWRKNFAEKTNEFYKANNIKETISHLSYEEQGIEKLGKHRLTRDEYHVEKQAEKQAEENGTEYSPVTTYGNLNNIIEAYNNEIDAIDSKIVSLEEYKQSKQPVEMKEFEEIRRKAILASGDYEAIQFVKNRAKASYVDYEITKKTMDSLEFWKKSIDRKHRSLDREKKVLETAVKHYKGYSKDLFKLGFVREDFAGQYNPKAIEMDSKFKQLAGEFESYQEAFAFTKQALDLQKSLLKEEFTFIYPDYADIAEIDSVEISDIMNKYVNEFKENQTIHSMISEFEQSEAFATKEEQEFRGNVQKIVTDYRSESKQFFSLNKQLASAEKEYKDTVAQYKNSLGNSDEAKEKIYTASVKYLTTKNELDHLTSSYEKTKNGMYNSLIELYGKDQEEVIQKIPDRAKVALLESYLEERKVDELHKDLEEVKQNYSGKRIEDEWNQQGNSHEPFEQAATSGKALGNILSELIEQAKQNDKTSKNDESKMKRAKRKHKKLTKEDLLERGS